MTESQDQQVKCGVYLTAQRVPPHLLEVYLVQDMPPGAEL